MNATQNTTQGYKVTAEFELDHQLMVSMLDVNIKDKHDIKEAFEEELKALEKYGIKFKKSEYGK